MKIWLDDLRPAPEGWKHVKTSDNAIKTLDVMRAFRLPVEAISFDHDLGGDDTSRAVVLWCFQNDFWPEKAFVHTANPVGREWLVGMLEAYGPGVKR